MIEKLSWWVHATPHNARISMPWVGMILDSSKCISQKHDFIGMLFAFVTLRKKKKRHGKTCIFLLTNYILDKSTYFSNSMLTRLRISSIVLLNSKTPLDSSSIHQSLANFIMVVRDPLSHAWMHSEGQNIYDETRTEVIKCNKPRKYNEVMGSVLYTVLHSIPLQISLLPFSCWQRQLVADKMPVRWQQHTERRPV